MPISFSLVSEATAVVPLCLECFAGDISLNRNTKTKIIYLSKSEQNLEVGVELKRRKAKTFLTDPIFFSDWEERKFSSFSGTLDSIPPF
ncbi:hypothetical protein PanWU01x14_134820 [Parasponia andersonii]|uniref:Uncharacterized protein n=1 Tax=Parasponia andersonii TaxID=3476 RepID=A0A2P5CPS6_PARAD|nr:hypothetical protein PanWU01x14_134820 [Parasponia andersonii]